MKPDEGITLEMQVKKPGDALLSRPVSLSVVNKEEMSAGHEAYERLLDEALSGDARLFARQDGVEAAWRIVQPVLEDHRPVQLYEKGTWGPPNSLVPDGGWHEIGEK